MKRGSSADFPAGAAAGGGEILWRQKEKSNIMDSIFTGYNSQMKKCARLLRKNMTRQERRLWHCFLKNCPVKFYRQRAIEHYIVDFYCSKAKLIVELDGSQHYTEEGEEYDRIRTDILERHGLEVIRFSNRDVDGNFAAVCEAINEIVHQRIGRQDASSET